MGEIVRLIGIAAAAMLSGTVIAQTTPDVGKGKINVDAAKAGIAPQAQLTIIVNGKGRVRSGSLLCAPSAQAEAASCTRSFAQGQRITVRAMADANHELQSFAGPCTRLGDECMVTLTGPATITATFIRPQRTLTLRYRETPNRKIVLMAGAASGFTCTETVINPGLRQMDCVRSVPMGSVVPLAARRNGVPPAYPPYFITGARWAGDCAGTAGQQCSVTVNTNKLVLIDPAFN